MVFWYAANENSVQIRERQVKHLPLLSAEQYISLINRRFVDIRYLESGANAAAFSLSGVTSRRRT